MIDKAQMAISLGTAALLPVLFYLRLGRRLVPALVLGFIGATLATHARLWFLPSGTHVGSTYSIAILMYFVLDAVVVIVALAIAQGIADRRERS